MEGEIFTHGGNSHTPATAGQQHNLPHQSNGGTGATPYDISANNVVPSQLASRRRHRQRSGHGKPISG